MMKEFNFDEFLEFIKWENSRLDGLCQYKTEKEKIYAPLAKLMEENGELASEVMVRLKHVRAEKQRENFEDLQKEFTDCLVTLFLLADTLGIDVKSAIINKVNIIKNRKY